jgi:flagellar protein FlbB
MAEKSSKATPRNATRSKAIAPQATSNTKTVTNPIPKKGNAFKMILILFILLILLGLGFAAGIYFKLIDVEKSAENMNLQDAPIIGKYFQKPKTNFDPVDLTPPQSVPPSPGNSLTAQSEISGQSAIVGQPGTVLPGVPGNVDLAKMAKQKQAQETKKISKLSRLYGNMKPEEVVPILTQLDDSTIVAILNKMEEDQAAKILAQFDPAKAAQISQAMLAAAVIQ